ncbi:MAG: sigma-70 family RNA polymerase sigma factor [Oscillospiraceae bacterium]|nr:sigma-70 family RNA polymerase sigma factor [Oscillospiraceae bacterium]
MSEFTGKLIRKAAAGDQDAITELYELTYSSVYKTVKSMIADEDTVLDIVQDSFIKGFQSLDQLDTPENFRAWMKRIATNKAKDYLKKKKPILFTDMANEDGEEIDFRDDCLDHCPEEVLDRKETARLMQEILSTLSEDQRLVIGMFYYEEMSVREIAETLGCSENTVKSRLNYGRKKVEVKVKELEKRGTKLYSLAPLPFLLWLFRMDAEAAEIPSGMVLEAVTAECAATGTAAAGSAGAATAASSGAKAAAGAGIKALTTKIIAGVLAVSVVGGGTMLALSSNDREEAEPTQQIVSTETISQSETTLSAEQETTIPETTVETVAAVAAEEAYRGITAEYQTVLGVDSATFLNAPDNYFNGDHMAIRYYHMYHGDNFYYAYMDIDGNGMEELLIGFGPEDYIRFVDLYGFDGERAVQLIDEPTLGDRSMLALLADGTLYLAGSSSATETSHTYLKVDGCSVKEVPDTIAERVTDIPWQAFDLPEIPASEPFFDSILTDIQAALMISAEDYDSNMEYYDGLYSHLGDGVMWMLLHRQAGDYTMCIWNTYLDIDGDGQDELCIGRGVSPSNAEPIVIYKPNGEAIYGDAVYAYNDLFYGGAPIEWNYLGG